MNAETFAKLLKDPAQLQKLPYASLKSLVGQYPYCQNLRFLLLQKCAFEDHEDYEENLKLAATFSNDRTILLKQTSTEKEKENIAEVKNEIFETEAEISESEQLNKEEEFLEENLETASIEKDEEVETEEISIDTPVYLDEAELETEIEDITEEVEIVLAHKSSEPIAKEPEENYEKVISFEELIELDLQKYSKKQVEKPISNEEEIVDVFEKNPAPKPKLAKKKTGKKKPPTPKSSFSSWVKQFQETDDLEDIEKRKSKKSKKKKLKKEVPVSKIQKKKKQEKKKKKGVPVAEKSLKENKDIVSETLANILASQGSNEKAIEMFEKLSLIIPEKSSYFADRIKKLKNN